MQEGCAEDIKATIASWMDDIWSSISREPQTSSSAGSKSDQGLRASPDGARAGTRVHDFMGHIRTEHWRSLRHSLNCLTWIYESHKFLMLEYRCVSRIPSTHLVAKLCALSKHHLVPRLLQKRI